MDGDLLLVRKGKDLMPSYAYACQDCGRENTATTPHDRLMLCCPCNMSTLHMHKRVWSVQFASVMHEHLNQATGKPTSSRRQFRDDLARASDEASQYTGVEHKFVEVGPDEAAPPPATAPSRPTPPPITPDVVQRIAADNDI